MKLREKLKNSRLKTRVTRQLGGTGEPGLCPFAIIEGTWIGFWSKSLRKLFILS